MTATKVGIWVTCKTCWQFKQPRGRDAPVGSIYCDSGCPGYYQDPKPGDLWANETDADFGYPCSDNATKPVVAS